jgi:hypothetical protein
MTMTEQHPTFEPMEADLMPPDGIAASPAQREAMRRVLIEMVRDGIAVPIGTDANGKTIFQRTGKMA